MPIGQGCGFVPDIGERSGWEPLGSADENRRIAMLLLKATSYPLELLCDANRLAAEAAKYQRPDDQKTTTPEERTFARSAIFTALNFVESLGRELTWQCLEAGGVDAEVRRKVEDDLGSRRAGVAKIVKRWPEMLGKKAVHDSSEFGKFETLCTLRNNLIHPNPEPQRSDEFTQDQLLQEVNAEKAAWAVGEAKKMGRRLYTNFGVEVPPEVR